MLYEVITDVQDAAVDALSMLKRHLEITDLLAMLKSEYAVLRRNMARLLGRIRAMEAVTDLGFALKDEKVAVRKAVVEALSRIVITSYSIHYTKLYDR